jgi:hypothetical protein
MAPQFLTSILDGGKWPPSLPGRFIAMEKSVFTHWIRGLGGPHSRSGHCGTNKNLFPCLERSPGRPDRSSSLDRLSSPSCYKNIIMWHNCPKRERLKRRILETRLRNSSERRFLRAELRLPSPLFLPHPALLGDAVAD